MRVFVYMGWYKKRGMSFRVMEKEGRGRRERNQL